MKIKLSHINLINTLVALFLLLLLNVQLIAHLPVFTFGYLFISLFGVFISLLGMKKGDLFYSYLGGSLHFILIISYFIIIWIGIGINYK